jgi:hypothetical protein
MHQFDEDIAIESGEKFSFTGTITDNWSINGNPNGGYLMAILANAMTKASDKKSTPILTANYISRSVPGKADMSVEPISQSTKFNRFQANLFQNGKEKIRAIGTFSDEKHDCFFERFEKSAPDIIPREECFLIPPLPKYTLFNRIDALLEPESAGWMQGRLSNKSEQRGWVKFKEDRPFDIFSIALIADSFPPPVLASQGMVAWVPTIEFSINIRNIPETKWLKCIFRTSFVNCGLLEEDGEVWDEEGRIIAISRQIAQYRNAGI